jgi:hypothetical protein
MRTRSGLRCLATIAAVAAAAVLAAGCSASAATDIGCDQIVLGVAGTIHPETSGMTCRQIRRMNSGVSPGGAPYWVESPFSGRLWKCRTHGSRPMAPLLRCEVGERRFSIIATSRPNS